MFRDLASAWRLACASMPRSLAIALAIGINAGAGLGLLSLALPGTIRTVLHVTAAMVLLGSLLPCFTVIVLLLRDLRSGRLTAISSDDDGRRREAERLAAVMNKYRRRTMLTFGVPWALMIMQAIAMCGFMLWLVFAKGDATLQWFAIAGWALVIPVQVLSYRVVSKRRHNM